MNISKFYVSLWTAARLFVTYASFLAACEQTNSEKFADVLSSIGNIVSSIPSLSLAGAIVQSVAKEVTDEEKRKAECFDAALQYLQETIGNAVSEIDKSATLRGERETTMVTIFQYCEKMRTTHADYERLNRTNDMRDQLIMDCNACNPFNALERFKLQSAQLFDRIIKLTSESEFLFIDLGLAYLQNAEVCEQQAQVCVNVTSKWDATEATKFFNEAVEAFEVRKAKLTPATDLMGLLKIYRTRQPQFILTTIGAFLKRLDPLREWFLMIFKKSDEEPEDATFIIPPYHRRDVTFLEQENGMRLIVHSSDCRRQCETQQQFFAGKTLKQLLFHDDTSGYDNMASISDGLKASHTKIEEKLKLAKPASSNFSYAVIVVRYDISIYFANITTRSYHHFECLKHPYDPSKRTLCVLIGWC